jgi:hypothetical protein
VGVDFAMIGILIVEPQFGQANDEPARSSPTVTLTLHPGQKTVIDTWHLVDAVVGSGKGDSPPTTPKTPGATNGSARSPHMRDRCPHLALCSGCT